MSKVKVSFGITVVIHTSGEVEFSEEEQMLNTKVVTVSPIVDVFGAPLDEEQKAILQLMVLHHTISKAYEKVKSIGSKVVTDVEINMNTPEGERS